VRAAAAQCAVLRDPGLNQVTLHAREQRLAIVQRQAERIERRMGVGSEPDVNLSIHPAPIIRPLVPGSSGRTSRGCAV
jgi:hypothetical protein